MLEKHPPRESLLDVGTGTGVLAIAAHSLGYKTIVGTEIDATAIEEAENNARLNHCSVKFVLGEFENIGQKFDTVVSNILVPEVLNILPATTRIILPGATLILSGFIEKELPRVKEVCLQLGFEFCEHLTIRGWVSGKFYYNP